MLGKLVGLVLGAVFLGALAPTAVAAIVNTSTVGWGAGPIAIWGVMALIVVAAFAILILKEVGIEF